MELKELEEIVEDMVLQLSYPGLDARSLNIALPAAANDAPVSLYVSALTSDNINVKLIALRWFQNRIGAAKHHIKRIALLLDNADPWIKKETIKIIEMTKAADANLVLKICDLLKDKDQIVRLQAAKALGNLTKAMPKTADLNDNQTKSSDTSNLKETVISSLQKATDDSIPEVRRKAIKALRKVGAFSAS